MGDALNQMSSSTLAEAPAGPVRLGSRAWEVLFSKFAVSNLARSHDYYTKLIGLQWARPVGQKSFERPDPLSLPRDKFVEIPLNFSGSLADPFFVLVQQPGLTPVARNSHLSWVGFNVQNLRALVERVRRAGYEVVREPFDVNPGGMLIGIVRDPDGYSVEFIEPSVRT
jgi:hypothetical protein